MKCLKTMFVMPFLIMTWTSGIDGARADTNGKISLADNIVRHISIDICLPATAEEYEELGKHAIVALDSTSAISTELPLRSVYLMHKGVRIQLQKIAELPKKQNVDGSSASQTSFYLIPIQMMKSDARILADFKGGRTNFGIMSFSKSEGLDTGAPAFARLDAYDTPFDPNMEAAQRVILREFPSYFE